MINLEALASVIVEAAASALGEGAKLVEARAKHYAPVRRLFADGGHRIRFKRASEIDADRLIRSQLGLGPEFKSGPRRARTRYLPSEPRFRLPPVHWRKRRTSAALQHLADYDAEMAHRKMGGAPRPTVLTRRGAYEVRSMRAAFASWGHLHVGGRLRGEIHATGVNVAGGQAEAWVISPTPYAKYQEFGTRHNAAHPFLRPAAEESRAEIVSRIAAAVGEAARTGASSTEIEIVVRI